MLWPLVFVALCVAAAVACWTLAHGMSTLAWPVRAREPLSPAEQTLYWRLRQAFPDDIVLAQVAVAQLLEVENVPNRRAVFNRYRQLVADFVVCTTDFGVIAVIELDDRSHMTPGRADADARKSAALGAAGILLLRFHASSLPSVGQLRSLLENPAIPAAVAEMMAASVPEQRRAVA
jgi:very-short-patch-repair endonuclease